MNRNKYESEIALKLCKYKCVICGWDKEAKGISLVEGAHIKPFECDNKADKFDNIIALCPNHHTQFDRFLFYINPQNRCTFFLDENDEYNNVDLSSQIKYVKKEYLAYRQYLFEVNNELISV